MNKEPKFIFLDIDGTIYNHKVGLVDDAVEAIYRLKDNGHKIFICTGRSYAGIDDEIINLGFDGIIAACGLYIKIGEKVIKNITLPSEILNKVVKTIVNNNCYNVILEGSENVYLDENMMSEQEKQRYKIFCKANKLRIRDFKTNIYNVNKFGVRVISKDGYEYLYNNFSDYFDITKHSSEAFEVVPIGYDKGVGLKFIMDYFKEDISSSIAIGDGMNDIPMFKVAGKSIIIGNKCEEASKYVDFISKDLVDNGFSLALKEFGLI